MRNTAFALCWCFVFVVPWENVVQLPVLGSLPHLVGMVAFVVGVLHILARGSVRPLSWFHVLALLFVIWAGVSGFWSIDPVATRARLPTYVQLIVLAWLIWELAPSPERQRALLQAYVLGACVAALATGYNYLSGLSFEADAARFTALSSNPNELGVTLVLGLPMAWYLSLSQPRRRHAWLWHIYMPLGITATLLTASRTAFVAALVALLLVPWTLGHLRLRTKAALYALAVVSLGLARTLVPEAALERLGSTRSEVATGAFGGRRVIWKAGWQVVREHPLAGVGAGAFGAAVEETLGIRRSSHSTLLSVLAEEGIIGLLLFLMMIGAVLTPLRRLPVAQRRFSIVMLTVLAVGSLSGHWDYRKQLWFVLGLLAAQGAVRAAPPMIARPTLGFAARSDP